MKLIITIPAYNEERSIVTVIRNLPKTIAGFDEKDIVVIDDGSSDKTAELARQAGAVVASHNKNLGLGSAFSTAVKEALKRSGDIMVLLDADGQYNGNDIAKLIRPIMEKRADFVSGTRFLSKKWPLMPKFRLVGNKIMAKFISFICGQKISDASCGFRAYSRESLFNLNIFSSFTYTQEVILSLSFKKLRMAEIPVDVKYFSERRSYLTGNLAKYIFNSIRIILRTIIDYAPFKIIGMSGIIIFSIGLLLELTLLIIFSETGRFSPNISIGITGLVLNIFGLFLIIIGLLAEMLYRIRQNQERILYYQKKEYYGEKY